MFDKENFKTLIKFRTERYKVLKDAKQYEEAIKELEQIVTMMSEAIMTIFGKKEFIKNLPLNKTSEQKLGVTFEDILDATKTIIIDKDGNLKIKT